jgi:hypothetical protein
MILIKRFLSSVVILQQEGRNHSLNNQEKSTDSNGRQFSLTNEEDIAVTSLFIGS